MPALAVVRGTVSFVRFHRLGMAATRAFRQVPLFAARSLTAETSDRTDQKRVDHGEKVEMPKHVDILSRAWGSGKMAFRRPNMMNDTPARRKTPSIQSEIPGRIPSTTPDPSECDRDAHTSVCSVDPAGRDRLQCQQPGEAAEAERCRDQQPGRLAGIAVPSTSNSVATGEHAGVLVRPVVTSFPTPLVNRVLLGPCSVRRLGVPDRYQRRVGVFASRMGSLPCRGVRESPDSRSQSSASCR